MTLHPKDKQKGDDTTLVVDDSNILPGKWTSSAPGSCQLPRPDGTHDLLLRRCRMASWDSNLRERQKEHKRKSAAQGVASVQLWQEWCFCGKKRLKGSPSRRSGGSNGGLPHFCSPPLGGEQGKKKLINQLSPAAYLYPGYGEPASVSMAAFTGVTLPREADKRYGYIKNHKKTVKKLKAHLKSTKKGSQRIKAEARKVKPQSNPVKEKSTHGQQKSTTRRQDPKYST
ncbi:hypothetical protein Tco_1102181 [Tanacetum coccineum]